MNQKTITLAGQKLIIKQSFRSLLEFEQMTGKNAFEVTASIADSLKIFYCILKAANQETFTLSFDEFLNALDNAPECMSEFNEYMFSLAAPETAIATKKKVEKR